MVKKPTNKSPTINFDDTKVVKYYDRHVRPASKTHFQQEANLIKGELGQRKITYSDFESAYVFAKDVRRKLPQDIKAESSEMKQYATVIESLTDIVLTINQKDIDRALNQTLPLKIRFLITNIKEFKGMYIGNHYCPEIIAFLLREFLFIKFAKVYNPPLLTGHEDEERERPVREGPDTHMFKRTIETLRGYCLELDDDY